MEDSTAEFSFFEAPVKTTTPLKTAQLQDIYNYITTNENAKRVTDEYRNAIGEDKAKKIKTTQFDFVTFSGEFTKRKAEFLVGKAPYVCLDLDDIEQPKEKLKTLTGDNRYPPTMGFVSPSGHGIKCVYTIDLEKGDHKSYYQMISGYLEREYRLDVDSSPSSVASACFLPHDPEAYFDSSCPVVNLPQPKKPTPDGINFKEVRQQSNRSSSEKDLQLVEACIKYIEQQNISIAEDYDDWYRLGLALTQFGEEGRHLFHRISAESDEYDCKECNSLYSQLDRDSRGEITLGTFFDSCKNNGVPLKRLQAELHYRPQNIDLDEEEDYDFSERDEYEVRVDDELEEEVVCLGIHENALNLFGDDDPLMKIATLGNFSTLIGKAKSRKTFLVSMLVAAALKGGRFQRRIVADFPKDKQRVLVFDTEQGTNDVLRVQRRIAKLAEKGSEFMSKRMKVFALRALTPRERMENIEKMLAKHRQCGLVVIDGIRDLVSSINDEDQATLVSSRLLRWTQDYQIHIMGVLHMNKGDRNARGHLGTEVVNKSESVISVTKNDATTSTVEPEYMRGKEFSPFTFSVDEDGLPYLVKSVIQQSSGKSKFTPSDIPFDVHQKFLKKVFSDGGSLMHTKLWEEVYDELGEKYNFGQSKAKKFPAWYVEQGLLSRKKKGNKKLYSLPDSS